MRNNKLTMIINAKKIVLRFHGKKSVKNEENDDMIRHLNLFWFLAFLISHRWEQSSSSSWSSRWSLILRFFLLSFYSSMCLALVAFLTLHLLVFFTIRSSEYWKHWTRKNKKNKVFFETFFPRSFLEHFAIFLTFRGLSFIRLKTFRWRQISPRPSHVSDNDFRIIESSDERDLWNFLISFSQKSCFIFAFILNNFSTPEVKSLINDLFFFFLGKLLQVFEIKKFPRRFPEIYDWKCSS